MSEPPDPFRVIIAGSRHMTPADYPFVRQKLEALLRAKLPHVEVYSGGAAGADALGERWSNEFDLDVRRFPADWENDGKAAGPIRNRQMCLTADALICFDGGGPGSADVIRQARRLGLDVRVVRWRGTPPSR